MHLFIIWVFITLAIVSIKLTIFQYVLFSLLMLCFTYIYNRIIPITMSIQNAVFLSTIPNACFWYLAYHCNDFLWVYPYNWHSFITVFLIYSYILLYLVWEC